MRRQKAQNRIRPWAVALWLVVWELASLYIGQEILLVSPVSVLRRLCDLALRPDFWSSIAFSFSGSSEAFCWLPSSAPCWPAWRAPSPF